jgi:hypothetical protein
VFNPRICQKGNIGLCCCTNVKLLLLITHVSEVSTDSPGEARCQSVFD